MGSAAAMVQGISITDLSPLQKQAPIFAVFVAGAAASITVPGLVMSNGAALLSGSLIVTLATVIAMLLTLRPAHARYANVIPALDFLAIGFLRSATGGNESFLGALVLLPVVWVAANSGVRYILYAVGGALVVTVLFPLVLGSDQPSGSASVERTLTLAVVFLLMVTMINQLAARAAHQLDLGRGREASIATELAEARAREAAIADELIQASARKSAIADELTQASARKSAIADELTQARARESAIADEFTQALARRSAAADVLTQVGAGQSGIADQLTQTFARDSGIADERTQEGARTSGIADERTQILARRSGIADERTQVLARRSALAEEITQARARESGVAEQLTRGAGGAGGATDELTQSRARESGVADEITQSRARESGVADEITQSRARESGVADEITQSLARESGVADKLTQSLARESGLADRLTQIGAGESAIADDLIRAEALASANADQLVQARARESAIADELTRAAARESAIAEQLTQARARESGIADQLVQARARESAIADELTQAAAREDATAEGLTWAAAVQRALLPKSDTPLPGYEISGICIPSEAVGGDFFDWYSVDGGLCFTLGDVMGKGVGAGIIAATARAVTRSARNVADPVVALNRTDETLSTELEEAASFATLFHARLHAADGRVEYVDAGHGLTILVRADASWQQLVSDDPPLGLALGFQRTAREVFLQPGDMIVSFSDGVLDLYDGTLRALDEVAMLAVSAEGADEMVDSLKQVAMRGSNTDDVTVLAVRRTG